MNYYRHYIGDFQRDTSHLSLTERGAYLVLLHHYYATEEPLPADHGALCRIAGAFSKAERDAIWTAMHFFEARDGCLWHKRVEAELEKGEKRSDKNRDIALAREARKRAERAARSEHETTTERARTTTRIEHETSTEKPPIPTANHHSPLRYEKGARKRSPGFDASRIELPEWLERELWSDWVADRADRHKPITERGAKEQLQTLDGFRKQGITPEQVIRHAISSGNQGLYAPPKSQGNGTHEAPWVKEKRERAARFVGLEGAVDVETH